WNHFPIAPDAALIEGRVAGPASAPEGLEQAGRSALAGISGFEQRAASRAVVNRCGDGEARAATLGEANQFGCHEFLMILGLPNPAGHRLRRAFGKRSDTRSLISNTQRA